MTCGTWRTSWQAEQLVDTGLLTLALVAGAVAAFNPCGFALLPAYLTVLVADPAERTGGGAVGTVLRALRFTTGMTVGFVAVFGIFGLVITPFALSVERYLPVVTVGVGVALIALGVWLMLGHSLAVPGLAGRGKGPTARWVSQVGYGVTFALASLSCTIAPFLAVTTGALRAGTAISVVSVFLVYALGMGTVVLVLSLAVATASGSFTARLRRAGPAITRFSGVLLLIAGGYVAWYGWFELRVLAGTATADPVVSAAIAVQGAVTRWVASLGARTLVAAAVGAGMVVLAAVALSRRRRRAVASTETTPLADAAS